MVPERNRDFVTSLERGLSVIAAFDRDSRQLTLSQVALKVGLSRSAARRFLLTLAQLGYVRTDGKLYRLTPRVLELGFAYLSSTRLPELAQPFLEQVSAAVQESCSLCVLDGEDVVYVASVPTKRIMSTGQSIGTRRPAYATSMGRALLAGLPEAELAAYLSRARLERLTADTVTDPEALRRVVEGVRAQGYALVDQELEEGLRSIAVPIANRAGQTVAALTVCAHSNRVANEEMVRRILPVLQETAAEIRRAGQLLLA